MDNSTSIKIPKKYQKLLAEVYHDSDGYWAYSKDGYYFSSVDKDCHVAHEDTQGDLLRIIKSLTPCNCEECKRSLAAAKKKNNQFAENPLKPLENQGCEV